MTPSKRSPRSVAVTFRQGQYKAVCDYAEAFGVKPEHAVVSLAMLGAVNWLIDNGNKYKKFHKKKNIMFVTMVPRDFAERTPIQKKRGK